MTQIVSSISSLPIYAPSAAYAPTNGADVSAIASAYAESAASGKLEASAIECDTASAITAIGGSSVGGGVVTSTGSASYQNTISNSASATGISSINGSGIVASNLKFDAVIRSGNTGTYKLASFKMWNPSTNMYDFGLGFQESNGWWGFYKSNELQLNRGSGTIKFNVGPNGPAIINSSVGSTCYIGFRRSGVASSQLSYDGGWYRDSSASASINTNGLNLTSTAGSANFGLDEYNYWNAKLDSSSIECTTASAITAIGGSSIGGGIDSATCSAIASSYQVVSAVGDDGTYITSINGSALSGAGGGGATGDYVEKSAIDVTIGNSNVASSSSIAIGINSIAKSVSFAQGSAVSASGTSMAQGNMVSAYIGSLAIGYSSTAKSDGCCIGHYNFGNNTGFAQGRHTTGWSTGFAQGSGVFAYSIGLGQGYNVTASGTSFAQGASLSAINNSFAQGSRLAAINYVTAFGKYNLHMDGDTSTGTSAAFVIGDGTADTARHDLMLVTKDGEITMYSSTSDTAGTGIMSSIRAISAAATGGGGVDSATVSAIASSYAESAVSSVSGNYAQSADVSATVDLVSTSSSTWDGVTSKMESTAVQSAYASASASQATANGVLYILIPDGV